MLKVVIIVVQKEVLAIKATIKSIT